MVGLNRFESWFLKRICKKVVTQSSRHRERITAYYQMLYDAAKDEFTEDDEATLKYFLNGCHRDGMTCLTEVHSSPAILDKIY
jgi:hypothetical protein